MRHDRSRTVAFLIAAATLGIDAASKALVVARLEHGTQLQLLPFFDLVHVLNRGAAFSLLHNAGGWQRYGLIAVALAAASYLTYLIIIQHTPKFLRTCCGLILGGALANMSDRILRGAVVDWIDLHWNECHWPAFNAADIAICAGALGMIAYETIKTIRKPPNGMPT